ncbi:VOC family protein [Staphylococcus nepalensis]|uniref:Glyoxalase-like domain protein n=1 Tax=Staphylococcus nepalensis TaxID=214473 RepID=A0A380GLF0_9STAP|nr:VOC family protein [Staphylococcus nepalensis]POA01255.1 VOC family protein [Staphylococcus nepalensis]GGB73550.1 sulfurtransferase [Staphylococcus nepalensis]SUM54470.1 glyoxalase-like domain protein [Staphylococcus nepalensis]VDG66428.1 Uncharacterised protein [Lacrimispora indolis]
MKDLKLDHIVHYVQQLDNFKFPGHIFTLHQGGKHDRLGTYNRLAYLNNAYIELLDVYKPETLQKIIKSEEGRVSFPSKIVQDHYQQGLKTIAFQTQDISKLKENLEAQNIEVVGPIEMDRENTKGEKTTWKLLYIADPDYRVKPPFFIQWGESVKERETKIAPLRQEAFTIKGIEINSTERNHTAEKWKQWFGMEVVSHSETETTLKLKNDDVVYRIYDGAYSGYKAVILKDNKTASPYTLIIRGLKYKVEAD